jgi:hypothetical protein
MSDADPVDTPPQPAAKEIRTEGHALVQVEKWMAMIRELGANPREEWPDAGQAPTPRDGR